MIQPLGGLFSPLVAYSAPWWLIQPLGGLFSPLVAYSDPLVAYLRLKYFMANLGPNKPSKSLQFVFMFVGMKNVVMSTHLLSGIVFTFCYK